MARRGRSVYRIPWDDAALIVGGEEILLRILGLASRSRKSTKSRKAGDVPIQDIGKQIHEAWKKNQRVDIDVIRKQARDAGYEEALAAVEALDETRRLEVARLRQVRG